MAPYRCLDRARKMAQLDPFLDGAFRDLEPFCDIAHGQVVLFRAFGWFV